MGLNLIPFFPTSYIAAYYINIAVGIPHHIIRNAAEEGSFYSGHAPSAQAAELSALIASRGIVEATILGRKN